MAATMNTATFMGKNASTIQNFIMNSEDLTLKQMFGITAKWWANKMRSIFWKPFIGERFMRQLSLIGDETVINLQRTKVYVFSDSVLCLNIQNQRSLKEKDSRGHVREKLQRL